MDKTNVVVTCTPAPGHNLYFAGGRGWYAGETAAAVTDAQLADLRDPVHQHRIRVRPAPIEIPKMPVLPPPAAAPPPK